MATSSTVRIPYLPLHIVAFNVPWPANYGGVIDVFFRLKALHAWGERQRQAGGAGLHIELHCFDYGRGVAAELEKYARVHYYPRKAAWTGLLSSEPYIVSSRGSVQLLDRLLANNAPILFDGLHTCHYLPEPQLATRRKVVRMHNVEWRYYRSLAEVTRGAFKEWYFREEARRLKRYERVLDHADTIACIAPADTAYYAEQYGTKAWHLPAFHPFSQLRSKTGVGDYALYHGNLSVPENVQAATYLAGWWPKDALPLVLAGMDPDWKLVELLRDKPHIRLVSDPPEQEMDQLVQNAQLHALPTFQSTGIKLKLLRSLFQGRHVIANTDMVAQTGLEAFVRVADGQEAWEAAVRDLSQTPFGQAELQQRKALELRYSNDAGAERLIQSLFAPRPR